MNAGDQSGKKPRGNFLLMFSSEPTERCAALYASLNSLICDYVARQKLGGTSFKNFTLQFVNAVTSPLLFLAEPL